MSFIVNSILFPLTGLVIFIVTAIIVYYKFFAFTYWEKRRIPYSTPSIPAGNIGNALIGKQSLGEVLLDLYKEFKHKGYKQSGVYVVNSPIYMPLDPDIIKNILIKDFSNFVDRGVYYNEKNEPLTAHLFAIEGTKWKNLRAKLSPTFTSGKMKMMFQTLVDCSEGLKQVCDNAAAVHTPVDIKDILARYTTDIIGSVAFGLECNCLKDPDAQFRKMGRRIFEQTTWEAAKTFIGLSYPGIAKLLNLSLFNKEASDFFMDAVKQTVDYREKTNMKRNDFLQLLIQLKNQGRVDSDDNTQSVVDKNPGTKITFNEAAAQAFVFYLAGFETSSTAMTFCLLELAQNDAIQDKLRAEVFKTLKECNGQLTYEAIMKMTYMEKVLQETLRKYPPVPFLNRQCTTQYKIPNTNLTLEKGQNIFIPVYGLQTDPEYYPNPDVFDPERFSEENKAKRHPCVFMPFGEGPRICIGLRFGVMQAKVGLAILLSRYSITLNDKTKTPIRMEPKSIVLSTEGGVWINLKNLEQNNII